MQAADNASDMRATRPLFRLDPGWLFIIAGLAVCAAGVLLPAQADLRALEDQLAQLRAEEARAYQRLAAHADFIDQVERGDAAVIKRLAAAQLNMVPVTDKPLLLAGGGVRPVTLWIDTTLDPDVRPTRAEPVSTLSRWANGASRLWMFGGGIMAVFIGALISPEGSRRSRRRTAGAALAAAGNDAWMSPRCSTLRLVDDLEHDAIDSADDAELDASMPETIDVDDHDLAQMADTVDLEEDELLPVSRSVIGEDDHKSGKRRERRADHAAELIVEAKEIARAPAQLGDEACAAADDEDADDAGDDQDLIAWRGDGTGHAEMEMLLNDEWTAGTGLLEKVEQQSAAVDAGDETDAPVTNDMGTKAAEAAEDAEVRSPSSRAQRRRGRGAARAQRRSKSSGAAETLDSDDGIEESEKPSVPSAEDDDKTDVAASIPFLRYRNDLDDDAQSNLDDAAGKCADMGEDEELSDDDMPSMSADDSVEIENDEEEDEENEAGAIDESGDDEGERPPKFRRRR